MVAPHPEPTEAATLAQDAWDYCITPLLPVDEIRAGGLHIYKSGEGVRLTDYDGNTWLDMMSSHTRANSLGYGNAEIAQAVADQLSTLHYVGTVSNFAEPTIRLAKRIAEKAPGDLSRVLFVSGGSEAVEAALKMAKQYQIQSGNKPRAYKVISRWNAYHGATMGAMSATDWLNIRPMSEPTVPGVSFVPGPMNYRNPFGMSDEQYADHCATALEQQILHEGPELVAAFIAEPVMQAHGVQIAPTSYFQRLREICDKYGVLWIDDEVITGFGRTGNWFAIERAGVVPDIMTFAKALTAGYAPMGGVITTARHRRRPDRLPPRPHLQRPRRRGRSGQHGDHDQGARQPDRGLPHQRRIFPRRPAGGARTAPDRRAGPRYRHVAGRRLHEGPANPRTLRRRHGPGRRQAHARLRRDRQPHRHQLRDGPAPDHQPIRPRRRRQNRRALHPRNRQGARLPVAQYLRKKRSAGRLARFS